MAKVGDYGQRPRDRRVTLPSKSATPAGSVACPKCGAYALAAATTCNNCGSALGSSDAETVISSSASATPDAPTSDSSSSSPSSAETLESPVLPHPQAAQSDLSKRTPDFGPRYRVERVLGEGGMGTVYKVKDLELDRTVALKLVRRDLTYNPEILQRFKQELLLASRISHRNILRIHDLGDGPGDTKFISMAFVEGEDLHQLLKREKHLPLQRALNIAHQLCVALEAAHAEGVVHRDLKPQNILVDHNDHVYVSDFGLAKSLEGDLGMTRTGQFLGTPRYMSPEQVDLSHVDARSDLYAFGLILCELVTGTLPFERVDSTMQMMYQRVHGPPKDPKKLNPDLPDYLAKIIQKCLERDVALRYQSAAEILADLDAGHAPTLTHHSRIATVVADVVEKPKNAWLIAAAAVALLVGILLAPPVRHALFPGATRTASKTQAPVRVLVADFTNHTGDPVFDGTLEPMFNVALEGASFIDAFDRGDARKAARKLPNPTDKLDEQSSRLIAVSQGIAAVVIGSLSRRGDGYKISVEALDARSGNSIATADAVAGNKDEVLRTIPKLVAPIRKALGDNTPESVQVNTLGGGFTAASLEVVHQEGIAMEQQFAGKFEDALQSFSKAAELDPNFALAYSGMAALAFNLGRQKDAEKYIRLAMAHEDRMTERERFRNRGLYYLTTGNWQKCVEEYTQLVSRYPGERVGRSNLASCLAELRKFPEAVAAARQVVEMLPKSALYRMNLSFLSSAGGDFLAGEQEARTALQLNPSSESSYLMLGEAQLGQGQLAQATESYRQLEKLRGMGSSMAATALADLAVYEGRFDEAVRILEQGAAADLAAKSPDAAANKFAALAYTQLSKGQKGLAVKAAEKALANDQTVSIRFLAARIFVECGDVIKAQKLAASLSFGLLAEPQAYAKIIEGMLALKRGDVPGAVKLLNDANNLLDTWIGHFELGRAYLQAGAFVEADSEFDRCIKRRGEALELFMDDVPTYGYFPPVYYYQGRVREGLKSPESANSYRNYLSIRDAAGEDPLLAEVRERAGQ